MCSGGEGIPFRKDLPSDECVHPSPGAGSTLHENGDLQFCFPFDAKVLMELGLWLAYFFVV
jgi:hypothetical protein